MQKDSYLSYCRYDVSKKNKTSVADKIDLVRRHKNTKLVTVLRLDKFASLLTKVTRKFTNLLENLGLRRHSITTGKKLRPKKKVRLSDHALVGINLR